ncbi:hypothetical protein ATKI12_1896 [Kitasatospora sp. Ki12]
MIRRRTGGRAGADRPPWSAVKPSALDIAGIPLPPGDGG